MLYVATGRRGTSARRNRRSSGEDALGVDAFDTRCGVAGDGDVDGDVDAVPDAGLDAGVDSETCACAEAG